MRVGLKDIQQARQRLQGVLHETQTDLSSSASQVVGSDVFFKYENTQLTGSFKIRGAFNKISSLTDSEKKRGVVASSAGNHAQGVALSAKLLGTKATIVMPVGASLNKVSATRSYGAEVVLHGAFYDEAYAKAREIEKETGAVFVHPYEDPFIVAGQGTVALEILEKVPDLDSIVVAIGGGGLISGIATAIKALRPQCRVIGVQTESAPSMAKLFRGESDETQGGPQTIADGIAVKNPSQEIFESFIRESVDEIVTVNDDEIAAAIVFLLERTKNLVEGAGAVSLAAMMNRSLKLGKKTCAVLSGGNIDLNVIAKVVTKGLIRQGRLAEFSVVANDQPGTLELLTRILAAQKANIMEIRHDRVGSHLSLREAKIDFVIETMGPEHSHAIMDSLKKSGFRVLA
ncbi:MAG: threonine ammonia-lyase [Bdellovibrionaceae bacterium]|nr:threonine ammonia-lyase [Pseudobdellovibrionaceae bacterium]